MKRLLTWVLIIAMIIALSACGMDEVQIPSSNENQGTDIVHESEEKEVQVPEDEQPEITFEEVVVWDDENCTIKITGIDEDNLWGYTLKAYLENKTSDKTMMFSISSAAINGVSADPLFAAEVAPGKKSNEEIPFSTEELEEQGVGDFTDIALNFRVSDSNDWSADTIAEASAHIYPYGEENAIHYVREVQPEDTIIVDNEYVTITVIGYEVDEIWGYTAKLYIVNHADVPIMVSADEVSVNGYMVDPFYAESVGVGFSAFSDMTWAESDFIDNGIDEVESIEFALRVYDETDWLADNFVDEVITLNP